MRINAKNKNLFKKNGLYGIDVENCYENQHLHSVYKYLVQLCLFTGREAGGFPASDGP